MRNEVDNFASSKLTDCGGEMLDCDGYVAKPSRWAEWRRTEFTKPSRYCAQVGLVNHCNDGSLAVYPDTIMLWVHLLLLREKTLLRNSSYPFPPFGKGHPERVRIESAAGESRRPGAKTALRNNRQRGGDALGERGRAGRGRFDAGTGGVRRREKRPAVRHPHRRRKAHHHRLRQRRRCCARSGSTAPGV
ncbi:hypothetical protein ACVWZA_002604 [Sphingomonas sp. UYAg733]